MKTEATNIGVFGYGTVGQGLHDIIQRHPELNLHIRQIGVKNPEKQRPLAQEAFTFNRQAIIQDPAITMIAELTNDENEGFEIVKEALLAGKKVVSANKKMIAQNLGALVELQQQQGQTLLYEGAVCGSIPLIRTLEDYFSYEPIEGLQGIFNGSSNYILSKIFNEQVDYQTALTEAQEKGYAEADPTLDAGGYDAQFKLAIAASHAFGITVDPANIATLGIQHLSSFDENQARQNGQKLKLVAKAVHTGNGQVSLLVLPEFIWASLTSRHKGRSEQRTALHYLIFGRFTATNDLQIKVQGKARQWMIGIHFDQVAVNAGNLHDLRFVTCVGLKLHTHLQVFNAFEQGAGHFAHKLRLVLAISHRRRHGHFEAVANIPVFNGLLDPLDDLRAAMDKMQRLAAFGSINQLANLVLQHIMDGKYVGSCL